MQLLIVASIHYDIYVLKSSKQAKLGFGKPKKARVKIVSFEVETKKETGINHQVFRNCAGLARLARFSEA